MATEKRLTRSRLKESEEVCSPCKKLKNSNVDVACATHDRVGCTVCVSTNHSSCSDSMSGKQLTSDQQGTVSADNKQSSYRIKNTDIVNIKLKAHRDWDTSPDVWSMCILESANVLLADRRIPVISMLDHKTYKVQPVLSLPATSHSLCKVNNQEVVVALSNKTLQFVSIKEEFVLTRSIQLDHLCLGIDVVLDQIYVTDGMNGNIFIYDLNGEIITKIENEPNGNKIFSWNRFITVSEGGDTMHVTDRDKGVVTVDRKGNVILGYTVPGVTGAFGICKDGNGNLFVTGRMSNNVALLGQDGIYQEEVISSQHCVVMPEAVCFDRLNSKLYVTGASCHEVYVYTLH